MVRGYATVSKGRDVVFIPGAGCEPLMSPRTLLLLLLRGGVPLRGAKAKNRGPLQAVPVMARAAIYEIEDIALLSSQYLIR
jgi:hypothetical protein